MLLILVLLLLLLMLLRQRVRLRGCFVPPVVEAAIEKTTAATAASCRGDLGLHVEIWGSWRTGAEAVAVSRFLL